MKKRFLKATTWMLGALMMVASVAGMHQPSVASATRGAGDETWSLLGNLTDPATGNRTTFTKDFDLTYNASASRYEITFAFLANDAFKVRYNYSWSVNIGWGGNTGGNIGTYLTYDGDSNFVIKTAGTYLITVNDDQVYNYGDKSYGFGIERVTVTYRTVTYYNGSTSIGTDSVISGTTGFKGKYIYQEGYRLEGWYTDAALTRKVTSLTVSANMSLYGKYEVAENYVIYFLNTSLSWSDPHVYLWNGEYGHKNLDWPGESMTPVAGLTNVYYFEIDGGYNYDNFIFNDGIASGDRAQSDDTPFESGDMIYALNTASHETVSQVTRYPLVSHSAAREVVAHISGDTITKSMTGFTQTATTNAISAVYLEPTGVRVVANDPTITIAEKQEALVAYFKTVSANTCENYVNYASYLALLDSAGISDIAAQNFTLNDGATMTFGDYLAYLNVLVLRETNSANAASHNLFHNMGQSNALLIVILVGVLGLGSVLGYYLINRKKYAN